MYKIISDDKAHAIFAAAMLIGVLVILASMPLMHLMIAGDFTSPFYGLQEDHPIVTFLLDIRNLVVSN